MPITVEQAHDSFRRNGDSVELDFIIYGTATLSEATEALVYAAPQEVDEWPRRIISSIEPIFVDTTNPEVSKWAATVQYTKRDVEQEDEKIPVISFDTTGGNQHITQSIETVARYPDNSPDYGGAIGYDGENVVGVDIAKSVLNFSEVHYLAAEEVTWGFIDRLSYLGFNDSNFRNFKPCEVLFLGAAGTRRADSSDDLIWEVNYRFAVSRNRYNFRVGDITVSEKRGWDYMWVRYADEVDDEKQTVLKKPVAVYIERVLDPISFSGLGVGA